MASLARSFKPSAAYLSPRPRPAMPGRTLSNSSELSVASNSSAAHADDAADVPVSSAPGTPAHATRTVDDEHRALACKKSPDNSSITSPRSADSRPIAIELPNIKKLAAAPVYTPPEPLSVRGDLPGGYFPMHEDPKGYRIHRPHPFHQDAAFSRHRLHQSDSVAMHAERKDLAASMAQASMPVSSYLAPGFHDSPLPMGKYYPSNYEQHQRTKAKTQPRLTVADSLAASVKPDVLSPKHASQLSPGETPEVESRRKMQQYQRDMIAQAAMALGGSSNVVSKSSLSAMSLKDIWLAAPSVHKPLSPRLHPLGSPATPDTRLTRYDQLALLRAAGVEAGPSPLLSCLSKGLERLIARRLAWASVHFGVLHPQQAGALPMRSAVDLVAALVYDIDEAFDRKQVATLVALDVQGTFDTVLRNRSARIRYQDTVTDSSPLQCGLPQGSPVSPILFLLYMESIYRLGDAQGRFGYADDIAILCVGNSLDETSAESSHHVRELVSWGAAYGIAFDPENQK
ncbi:hypothetical protein HIM_11807 [Hirsutella minnesotensis 3608]|uniref:Reverse transcriptase domain-containing protein n=1 Tax=Hirsutella minnesotensis 3608 TaxID=1043627 RepID=A0A0F7ZR11_9HYPO|nr:hypothetical protein HIM_11807 [Hirsutella minnesotensis 3608]